MTTTTFSDGPTVGGFVLGTLGRASFWTLTKIISAPFSAALLGVMAVGTVMAASNALYFQVIEHPAPMFADETITAAVSPVDTPQQILPVVKPEPVPLPSIAIAPVVVPTPLVAPVPAVPKAVSEITNTDIKALQQKLASLGLYVGEADGFYGPQTAEAIRAFEGRLGLLPIGAVTPEVLQAAANANLPSPSATVAPSVVPAPIVKPIDQIAALVEKPVEVLQQAVEAQQIPRGLNADPLSKIVQRVATATQNGNSAPIPTQNRQLIENIQRGLASLGFLRGKIDGVAGEATAKAIRNFEVYYNYEVTGAVTPELIDLLTNAGAEV